VNEASEVEGGRVKCSVNFSIKIIIKRSPMMPSTVSAGKQRLPRRQRQ